MKKLWYCILFFNLLPLAIFGQNEYISTGSKISIGIKLIDGGDVQNSRFCQVLIKRKIIKYSPYEIKEYGFKNGREYLSRDIQLSDSTERVFLERLSKGRITLYYYKRKGLKTFFLEKDSSLFIEFPKVNKNFTGYKEQLLGVTYDCSNIKEAISYVRYNKNQLSEIINRYNNCELKPFPHFRYGLIAGYEIEKLITIPDNSNKDKYYFDFNYDGGGFPGLFIDSPISVSNFSLHTEFFYSRHGYSYNKQVDNKDMDFVANISSLKLPILIRYSYPSNKFCPFVNAGGVFSFNIRNENLLYKATISGNIIEINDTEKTSLINEYQFGYSAGGGTEYKLNFRNSLFIELRYTKLHGNNDALNISGVNLITGIYF